MTRNTFGVMPELDPGIHDEMPRALRSRTSRGLMDCTRTWQA